MDFLAPLALSILGAAGLLLRWRKGMFLTPGAGWHGTLFLLYGVSGLAYMVDPVESRVPASLLVPAYNQCLTYLAYGQVIALVIDWYQLRKIDRQALPSMSDRTFRIAVFVAALAMIGYVGVQAGLGNSGVGTIFAVLVLFRYPSTVFLVVSAERTRQRVWAVLLTLVSVGFSIASPWRSELIYLMAAVLLGMGLRSVKRVTWLTLTGFVFFFYLLPFLNARKSRPDEFAQAPVEFFLDSQAIGLDERSLEFVGFVAVRLNQGRDLAHVALALDAGQLAPAGSSYYLNIVAQLVPRVLWPDKPSFNQQTGYDLPRLVGILAASDESTSWGVGLLGELAYVHGSWILVPAVPLVLLLLCWLDRLSERIPWRIAEFRHVVGACFLFLFLGPGSPINLATFVVWLFIFAYVADWTATATSAVGDVAGAEPELLSPEHRRARALVAPLAARHPPRLPSTPRKP